MKEYEEAKDKYNKELENDGKALETWNSQIKIYKSKANFFLGELLDKNKTFEELMFYMLWEHGIYIRQYADKKGLNDRFKIIEAFKKFK